MLKMSRKFKIESIFSAVTSGDVQSIQAWPETDRALLECTNVHGDQPLHVAIRNHQSAVVVMLLQCNVQINHANKMGHTPLHVAALANQLEIVKMLCQRDRTSEMLNAKDKLNRTPLACARSKKNMQVAAWLLIVGAKEQSMVSGTAQPIMFQSQSEKTSVHIPSPMIVEEEVGGWVEVLHRAKNITEGWELDLTDLHKG